MGVNQIAWIDQDEQKLAQARLLFHRQRNRNSLQRIVGSVARGGDDFRHNLHFPKDLTEDGIGSIQPAAVRDTDIELRTVIVGAVLLFSRGTFGMPSLPKVMC